MELIETKAAVSMRVRTVLLAAVCAAGMFHGTQAMAQARDRAQATYAAGFEILSNTQGVEEFMDYVSVVSKDIKRNWEPLIPEVVRAPQLKKGVVGIRFTILPDGSFDGPMVLENRSGDVALDKAAWNAIFE